MKSDSDHEVQYRRLLGYGLQYVSLRLRSEKELQVFIQKKSKKFCTSPLVAEQVMERLRELGYVDDIAFVRAFIESRNQSHPEGKARLMIELQRKGVSKECVNKVLQEVWMDQASGEPDLAIKAAQKRLRALKRYDSEVARQKLYTFLQRRGFKPQTIRSVIDELLTKGLQ